MENEKTVPHGTLKVSEEVISTITKVSANEIDGVVSIVPVDGVFRRALIKSDFIKIRLLGDVVEITVAIVVRYGSKVTTVAEKIQESVKASVQNMTGITVSRVNVVIAGISFDTKQ